MSVVIEQSRLYRADDLLQPGAPHKFVEIVEGELVVMTPARKHHTRVAYRFQKLFEAFCLSHPDLDFGGDFDGFLLARDPDTLLSPDATLYRRRPDADTTWIEFAPEIVVEVVSPTNSNREMLEKRKRFFAAGSEQFWIADPDNSSFEIFFRDGRHLIATGAEDVIDGEGIAAGMKIDLRELYANS